MQWFPRLVTLVACCLRCEGTTTFRIKVFFSPLCTSHQSHKLNLLRTLTTLNLPFPCGEATNLCREIGKSLLKRPCLWQLSSLFSDAVALFVLIHRAQVWNMSPNQDPSLSLSQADVDMNSWGHHGQGAFSLYVLLGSLQEFHSQDSDDDIYCICALRIKTKCQQCMKKRSCFATSKYLYPV